MQYGSNMPIFESLIEDTHGVALGFHKTDKEEKYVRNENRELEREVQHLAGGRECQIVGFSGKVTEIVRQLSSF